MNQNKTDEATQDASSSDEPARRPYSSPTLTAYGAVSRLTLGSGGTNGDGVNMNMA